MISSNILEGPAAAALVGLNKDSISTCSREQPRHSDDNTGRNKRVPITLGTRDHRRSAWLRVGGAVEGQQLTESECQRE